MERKVQKKLVTNTTIALSEEDVTQILREHLGLSEKANIDYDVSHSLFRGVYIIDTTTEEVSDETLTQ